MAGLVHCSKCQAALPAELLQRGNLFLCPSCRHLVWAIVFPALFQERPVAAAGERVMAEGESACFYHPQKKAVLPCDGCGRFLCALCEVELAGQHLCLTCLESGKKKGKLVNLQNQRTRYDSMAMMAAVLPILAWPVTLITAPASIYLALRHWKTPGSILHRSKWRFVVAIVVGLLQIAAWSIGLYYAFNKF